MPFYVYIIKSLSGERFYIGQCSDPGKRLGEHNRGIVRSTKSYRPWKIHHVERYKTRTEAIRREHYLKSPAGWSELREIKEWGRGFPEGIP